MRKVVVSEFVALDGVIENPQWTWPFMGQDREAYKFRELQAADALLLGRVTYEAFAGAWPKMAEQTGEYGAMMNGYPKYVATTTLDTLEWNATRLGDDLGVAITALKEQPGRDILVFGSGKLIDTLRSLDLIDEYRIMLFPVVVGKGQRLFTEGIGSTWQLADTETFESGVIALTYRKAPQAES